jgi:hypothetical protein
MWILRQIHHPHHLILVVSGLPFIVPLLLLVLLLLVLLLLQLQLLLLLFLLLLEVMSSAIRGVLHHLLPLQAILLLKKMRCKEVNNFILEKRYENEKVTLSLCEWVDEPTNDGSMCLIISARCLLAVLQP